MSQQQQTAPEVDCVLDDATKQSDASSPSLQAQGELLPVSGSSCICKASRQLVRPFKSPLYTCKEL